MSTSLKAQALIGLLALFSALCTVFVLVVSISDGWSEHVQKSWPEVDATMERCSVDPYVPLRSASKTPVWHIRCRIAYVTKDNEVDISIRSQSTSSHAEGMRQWVAQHPAGSSLLVHYNPADEKNAVLVATDMPFAGPRTPSNLKLLLIASVACVSFFTLARKLNPDRKQVT